MLAVATLVVLGVPAAAAADETLAASGSITYTWQGDPAHGCSAAGLCGVHGELVLNAPVIPGGSDFGGGPIDIPDFGGSATVRVAGPGGDCVDIPVGLVGGNLVLTRSRGTLVGRIEPAPSSGRCAGPLEQDFARLPLPVKRSGGKHPSFDLRTSRSFTAGPFSGRLVSTLRLRPVSPIGETIIGSSSLLTPVNPVAPPHKTLFEQVTLRYRVASLPATIDAAFSGGSDPFCAAVASCGTTGNLALSVGGFQTTATFTAERVVRKRVGPRQAMTDFRRGRLSFGNGGFPLSTPFVLPTTVNETLRGSGGTQCQAAQSVRRAELLLDSASGTHPRPGLTVSLSDSGDPNLLRTYCPGPNDTDVFGQDPALLRASVGPAQLLLRHSVVSLARPGSFAGLGYAGTRGGAFQFSLSLEHVHAGTTASQTPSLEQLQ